MPLPLQMNAPSVKLVPRPVDLTLARFPTASRAAHVMIDLHSTLPVPTAVVVMRQFSYRRWRKPEIITGARRWSKHGGGGISQVACARKGQIASPNEYLMPGDLFQHHRDPGVRVDGALRVILFLCWLMITPTAAYQPPTCGLPQASSL